MITNISNQNQFAKNETTKDSKDNIKEKLDKKTSLSEALKNPFFSKDEVKLPKDYVNKVDQKLQELLNKLLDQIKTNKDPDLAILKNHKDLNFAPNIANELKKLQSELSKTPEFEKLLKVLEDLVKPAKDINNKNLSSLVKNSGVFLEAKLNHSLKEQNLPQSFFSLLNTIKGATSENLKRDISNLDLKNLDTTNTLKELIHILQNHKKDNKISLENTNYKTLFKLFDKIENFKNYINKNPNSISQEKLQNIANNFIKNLNKNLALINKELAKPENIKIQNTHILKELSQNIKDLITLLKDIKNHKNKTETTQENLNKTPHTEDIKEELKEQIKTPQKNTEDKKETQQKQESIVKDKEIQNTKEEKIPQNKDIKENPKEEPKTPQKNTEDLNKNDSKSQNLQTNNTKLEDIFKSTSGKILLEDIFKQNVSKNLNFSQNLQEELLNNLNKELGLIGRKLNEVLKALDPKNYEAKNSLDDIKNIEKKLELSIKDLGKITPKDTAEISSELQKDIKSTLLQVSNLAKNLDNESILNQANRLIAQLEFNQLLSLANNSIHTFLPFFWDDLEKSNVVFKRGKKDKFYAQINLEFEKLGKINVFLSLSNDKYIDINMMIENANFRKKLYERAHELKKALVKVGLLSSNFFISDIVKSKFHNQEEYNDFNMGFDTRA
ncbi:flagellar hook-length control protein FliK [Campylobacter lari]|uniref:Flagellar hook-length control protein FliK n=1 Tax=Campylobacter lari TaxID=201 RepID=A0A825SHP6_CAMLA|nr:flagellar hook-length control protein FliK [Campylobacter lari]EAI4812227.1 flagellar hook-length control protein FliK [Campylobacter lari]EAI4841313.1 flagellar hook-length control protein FliK [Campylobacter lari]EAI9743594.1 flagellar hook-length control protein FliK [Campylobacter lari]EAK0443356.1 flagellar hook-length control protein FliK [Campylobacter lari]EAK0451439.1 flagellar hook-length control protein FliK [Campylobacter lari]